MSETVLVSAAVAGWVILWSLFAIGLFFCVVIGVELLKRHFRRYSDAEFRRQLRDVMRSK